MAKSRKNMRCPNCCPEFKACFTRVSAWEVRGEYIVQRETDYWQCNNCWWAKPCGASHKVTKANRWQENAADSYIQNRCYGDNKVLKDKRNFCEVTGLLYVSWETGTELGRWFNSDGFISIGKRGKIREL